MWGNVRIHYLPQEPVLDETLTVLDVLFQSDSAQMRLVREYERAVAALHHDPSDPDIQEQFSHLDAEMTRLNGWAAEANAKTILTRLGISGFRRAGEHAQRRHAEACGVGSGAVGHGA